MNAVSSFRPLAESEEYKVNQLRARESWEAVFDRIVFVNNYDERMASPKTVFVAGERQPQIRHLIRIAATLPGWTCLINADIVVSPRLATLGPDLDDAGAVAAISFRIEYEPGQPLPANGCQKKDDLGLDIFMARQEVWEVAVKCIPDCFTIGRNKWDNWVTSFFVNRYGDQAVDLTPSKLIYHPRHGGRRDVLVMVPPGEFYTQHMRLPARRLAL